VAREDRRQGSPEAIKSIVGREFGRMTSGRELPAAVATGWRAAVGDQVAHRALPVRLQRGTLLVRVANSTWLAELQLLAPSIVQKLALMAGCAKVERLRFEIGSLPERRSRRGPAAALRPPNTAPLPGEIARALDQLEDQVLKEKIERAIARHR